MAKKKRKRTCNNGEKTKKRRKNTHQLNRHRWALFSISSTTTPHSVLCIRSFFSNNWETRLHWSRERGGGSDKECHDTADQLHRWDCHCLCICSNIYIMSSYEASSFAGKPSKSLTGRCDNSEIFSGSTRIFSSGRPSIGQMNKVVLVICAIRWSHDRSCWAIATSEWIQRSMTVRVTNHQLEKCIMDRKE